MTNATRVTEEFPGEGKGVLEILPNPWDESKAMLLVEYKDDKSLTNFFEVVKYIRLLDVKGEVFPLNYLSKADSVTLEKALQKNKIRVYLYFASEPNSTQIKELEGLGVSLDLEHWVPPVGSHPYGFLPAEIPANQLYNVVKLDYIVRITSAELTHKIQTPSASSHRLPVENAQIREVGE